MGLYELHYRLVTQPSIERPIDNQVLFAAGHPVPLDNCELTASLYDSACNLHVDRLCTAAEPNTGVTRIWRTQYVFRATEDAAHVNGEVTITISYEGAVRDMVSHYDFTAERVAR